MTSVSRLKGMFLHAVGQAESLLAHAHRLDLHGVSASRTTFT